MFPNYQTTNKPGVEIKPMPHRLDLNHVKINWLSFFVNANDGIGADVGQMLSHFSVELCLNNSKTVESLSEASFFPPQ